MIDLPIIRGLEKDNELYTLLKKFHELGGTVCGGFPRFLSSHNNDTKQNVAMDIDIWPVNKSVYSKIIDFIQQTPGFKYKFRKSPYPNGKTIFECGYLLTPQRIFNSPVSLSDHGRIFQIIDDYGTPESIIKKFDFTVCQAYLDLDNFCIKAVPEFIIDDIKNEINIANLNDHHGTIAIPGTRENIGYYVYRLTKYVQKGYKITLETLLKILKVLDRDYWSYFLDSLEFESPDCFAFDTNQGSLLKFIGSLQQL